MHATALLSLVRRVISWCNERIQNINFRSVYFPRLRTYHESMNSCGTVRWSGRTWDSCSAAHGIGCGWHIPSFTCGPYLAHCLLSWDKKGVFWVPVQMNWSNSNFLRAAHGTFASRASERSASPFSEQAKTDIAVRAVLCAFYVWASADWFLNLDACTLNLSAVCD